jgi:hypothetical protein
MNRATKGRAFFEGAVDLQFPGVTFEDVREVNLIFARDPDGVRGLLASAGYVHAYGAFDFVGVFSGRPPIVVASRDGLMYPLGSVRMVPLEVLFRQMAANGTPEDVILKLRGQ